MTPPSESHALGRLDPVRDTPGEASVSAPTGWCWPTLGRGLFHPAIDLIFICGAFSLPFLWITSSDSLAPSLGTSGMVTLLIFFNYAHFSSSTLRLYTKPGAVEGHRFVAYGLPLVMLVATLFAIGLPEGFGRHFTALMLSWSPYHYAAQAYGLALLYCARSGVGVTPGEKRWLWWICMLPFLRAMINVDDMSMAEVVGVRGVFWLLPETVLAEGSWLADSLRAVVSGLTPLVFILPVAFAGWGRARLPVLALVLVLVNALWLTTFSLFDAVVWATVAHSVQYLFVVAHAHARDRSRAQRAGQDPTPHMVGFYLWAIAAGVALFLIVPLLIQRGAALLGQEWDTRQCYLMVVAAINLHHFIVDGYIWRSGPKRVTAVPVVSTAT